MNFRFGQSVICLSIITGFVFASAVNAQASEILNRIENYNSSTCQLVFNESYTCTGVLINNTWDPGRPLILTAAHCIESEADLDSIVVIFGKRKLLQEQAYAGLEWTTTGATLRSSSKEIDFALLELKNRIPDHVVPIYLGWNKQLTQPGPVYSIHSSEFGDQQYSYSRAEPSFASFGGLYKAVDLGHWKVDQWAEGDTSAGSSGAPLLNANFEIIGGMSGSTDWPAYKSDYFFRFDLAYDHFSNKNKQLKAWVDPDDLGRAGLYQPVYKIRNYSFNSSVSESIKLDNGALLKEDIDVGDHSEINGVYITTGDMSADSDSIITIVVSQNEAELYATETSTLELAQYSENYMPFAKPIQVSGMISVSLKFKTTGSSAYITIPKTSVGDLTSYFMAFNSSKP